MSKMTSVCISLLLHGGLFAVLGGMGFAPRGAPLAGGGGDSLVVGIRREKRAQPGSPEEVRPPLERRATPEGDSPQFEESPDLLAAAAPVPPPAAETGSPDLPPGPPGLAAAALDGAGIPAPRYPASCVRLGHQGVAVVRAALDAEGKLSSVELVRSAGCRELDRVAIEAMKKARFCPALRWGRAVASAVEQPFRFELR